MFPDFAGEIAGEDVIEASGCRAIQSPKVLAQNPHTRDVVLRGCGSDQAQEVAMRPWFRSLATLAVGSAALAATAAAAVAVSGCSEESSRDSGAVAPLAEPSGSTSSETAAEEPTTDLIADVEVDGRRIHVTCFGPTGGTAPTVLFEAGLGTPSDTWDAVVDALSTTHRTCAYDRSGTGASPSSPEPSRTSTDLATDLDAMLRSAGVRGPFVVVGHSMAVWPLAVFARAHPEKVAGVVLVDPRAPHVSAEWRAALPPPSAGEPQAVTANREELGAFEHDPSMNPEHLDLTRSAAEASAALDAPGPLFGDSPMVVLGAADTHLSWSDLPPALAKVFDRVWLRGQKALARESTQGTFESVADSDHEIQNDQPQAVVDAVESVLAAASG
jgi:pimeloyl-ACP methyl ester carboxylesterase